MTRIDPHKHTDTLLKTQKQKPSTRAEELRTLLKTLENRIAKISEIPQEEVLEIPHLFDKVERTLDELQQLGVNLASEQGQIDTLSAQFNKKRGQFIRVIGGPQNLAVYRKETQPPEDRWWWYVDLSLANERRQNLVRWLKIVGIAGVLLIILGLVYNYFFAPDPIVQESYGHQQRAENALISNNPDAALVEIQEAIALTPEDPRPYLMRGVIQETLDLSEAAQESYGTALQKYGQEDLFYNERATIYLMMGEPEKALADTDAALQINPDSAVTYLQRGNAYELLGDIPTAIENFEIADDIAEASGNAQLQAIIRISLSSAYQSVSVPTLDVTQAGEGE